MPFHAIWLLFHLLEVGLSGSFLGRLMHDIIHGFR